MEKNIIGTLTVRIKIFILPILAIFSYNLYGQDPNQNYIKTTTYKVPSSTPIQNTDPDKVAIEITYIDGLGRPKQKIAHKQSGNGEDLVTHIEYDGFGRQPKDFLPYERSASLDFDVNGPSSTEGFYSDPQNGPTTDYPWSQKLFEESPLNRILKQAAPGDQWAIESNLDHEIKFAYETNISTEVHYFSVSLSGTAPSLVHEGKYPEDQLYKAVTKDENWQSSDGNKGTVIQFKDKMGRIVLKRTFDVPIGEGKDATGIILLDSYYIYDVYGNLTFVLPPKLSAQIPANGNLSPTLLEALAYQYQYDHRNRMIAKRVPGKDQWDYMVYDALDRLTATGPALSPFGDQAEGWLHTKYDIFNRVAYTFWKQGPVTPSQRDALANALPTYISETRSGNNIVNGVTFSYTNQVPPTSGYHMLTVNYYDDYDYTDAPSAIPSTVGDGDIDVYYKKTAGLRPKGLPTGRWVREVGTIGEYNGIKSYSLYDKKARPVSVKSTNAASGYTQSDTKFNFIGNPLYTKTQHKKDASGYLITTKDIFTYTDQSRPLKHTHRIGNGPEQLLSLNEYDALGRMIKKKVGNTDAAPLQIVDYKYNVRGWLTDINNILNLSQQGGGPLDLFAFKINYTTVEDDINGTVLPLYNGNIAETFWRTSSDNIQRKYGYSYDYQNRLLSAYYQKPATSVPLTDSYSTHYSYDRNGNILTLNRNGEQDLANNTAIQIDDLLYTYDDGNQLKYVRDYETLSAGYNDAHTTANQDDFEYDPYGNLIEDKDKGITNVFYNHLNLPTKILFSSGGKIEYFYDATGIKLKKKVTEGTTIKNNEYMDGFQYTDNVLDFFPHSEGYTKAIFSTFGGGGSPTYLFRYVFNFTDHLGNIRLNYAQDPNNNNQVTILEENHYYPYGLKHKGYSGTHLVFTKGEVPGIILTPVSPFLGDSYMYKFGGKEYDDTFDINTYDFGARNYDPALGRWMNIDPLGEYAYTHSPYHYAYNNPIYYIDPDGMMALPMAVTTLGQGISGVQDIGGGGGGLSGDSSGQQPDPQYPNTSGVQKIEEVNLGVVKKKDHPLMGNEDSGRGNIFSWGNGTEDDGREGKADGELNLADLPTTLNPGGSKTPNGLMEALRKLLGLMLRDNKIKKLKPSESTMEIKNEEPVEPPEPKEYYVQTYETWIDTEKKAGGTRYINTITTLKEAKKDSARLMKIKPNNSLRRRDSVVIKKVN